VNPEGAIIGRGCNNVEEQKSQRAHAEMTALSHAGQALGNWRLAGCWMYVSLEPCTMCIAAMRLSRLAGVVFGAFSPLYGYRLDNICRSPVYNNDTFVAISGVCAPESTQILKDFFRKKRMYKDENRYKEVSSECY
jgi:tRNA(adenine34) deaminase